MLCALFPDNTAVLNKRVYASEYHARQTSAHEQSVCLSVARSSRIFANKSYGSLVRNDRGDRVESHQLRLGRILKICLLNSGLYSCGTMIIMRVFKIFLVDREFSCKKIDGVCLTVVRNSKISVPWVTIFY